MTGRKMVWTLDKEIDGYYTPDSYFGTALEANDILEVIKKCPQVGGRWKVFEHEVWMEAGQFIADSEAHIAGLIRKYTDPEWAEYQRLHAKFGGFK